MAALAAGVLVVPAAALFSFAQGQLPIFGVCQSAVAGPPPTAVVIDWTNGTQTTYAVSLSGLSSVLYQVLAPTSPSIVGSVVQLTGFPNPGQRFQGVVVNQFHIEDPSGTDSGEWITVHTPAGYVSAVYAAVTVVAAA